MSFFEENSSWIIIAVVVVLIFFAFQDEGEGEHNGFFD